MTFLLLDVPDSIKISITQLHIVSFNKPLLFACLNTLKTSRQDTLTVMDIGLGELSTFFRNNLILLLVSVSCI